MILINHQSNLWHVIWRSSYNAVFLATALLGGFSFDETARLCKKLLVVWPIPEKSLISVCLDPSLKRCNRAGIVIRPLLRCQASFLSIADFYASLFSMHVVLLGTFFKCIFVASSAKMRWFMLGRSFSWWRPGLAAMDWMNFDQWSPSLKTLGKGCRQVLLQPLTVPVLSPTDGQLNRNRLHSLVKVICVSLCDRFSVSTNRHMSRIGKPIWNDILMIPL